MPILKNKEVIVPLFWVRILSVFSWVAIVVAGGLPLYGYISSREPLDVRFAGGLIIYSYSKELFPIAIMICICGLFVNFFAFYIKKKYARYNLYIDLIVNQQITDLGVISHKADIKYERFLREISKMLQHGYFANEKFYLQDEKIELHKAEITPSLTSIVERLKRFSVLKTGQHKVNMILAILVLISTVLATIYTPPVTEIISAYYLEINSEEFDDYINGLQWRMRNSRQVTGEDIINVKWRESNWNNRLLNYEDINIDMTVISVKYIGNRRNEHGFIVNRVYEMIGLDESGTYWYFNVNKLHITFQPPSKLFRENQTITVYGHWYDSDNNRERAYELMKIDMPTLAVWHIDAPGTEFIIFG